ncbi:MAG: Holliday junction branch migration protein RuvA [Sphaerochaetaceae bacterium]
MLNALIGEVVEIVDQEVVIRTVSGVEYAITISNQCISKLSQLGREERKEVRLLTSLQVREDSMTLYGFVDTEERLLFQELLKVSGIGPKQAIKIISGVPVREFVRALDENDIKFLASLPGIGVKTSQKIVLVLRGKIVLEPSIREGGAEQISLDAAYKDLVVALCDMGYDRRQVLQTLKELIQENSEALKAMANREKEEYLFKNAIIRLV